MSSALAALIAKALKDQREKGSGSSTTTTTRPNTSTATTRPSVDDIDAQYHARMSGSAAPATSTKPKDKPKLKFEISVKQKFSEWKKAQLKKIDVDSFETEESGAAKNNQIQLLKESKSWKDYLGKVYEQARVGLADDKTMDPATRDRLLNAKKLTDLDPEEQAAVMNVLAAQEAPDQQFSATYKPPKPKYGLESQVDASGAPLYPQFAEGSVYTEQQLGEAVRKTREKIMKDYGMDAIYGDMGMGHVVSVPRGTPGVEDPSVPRVHYDILDDGTIQISEKGQMTAVIGSYGDNDIAYMAQQAARDPNAIMGIQEQMFKAGRMSKKDFEKEYGTFGTKTQTAYEGVLGDANEAGLDRNAYLASQISVMETLGTAGDSSGGGSGSRGGGGGGGGAAINPYDLRMMADEMAQKRIGRKLSDSEANQFAGSFMGIFGTGAAPDVSAQNSIDTLFGEETMAHNMAGVMDNFMSMLNGIGGTA